MVYAAGNKTDDDTNTIGDKVKIDTTHLKNELFLVEKLNWNFVKIMEMLEVECTLWEKNFIKCKGIQLTWKVYLDSFLTWT